MISTATLRAPMEARNTLFQSTSNKFPNATRSQNELLAVDVARTVDESSMENNNEPTCSDETRHSPKRRKRHSLQFNESVTVMAIPMRNEYSRQVRSKLWSNRLELQQNAARNVVEFAAEGWNWRTVVEDERMYVCAFSGQRIHPCHCDPDFDNNQAPFLKQESP
ncbi:hypothetical protein FisN_30Hh039 [Fistulifera solaris]|uniref:Uncharacterized protein n=1 Tax=Fistulifera solaris TaxID=1519565 RepID=A0A1Z5K6J4_FISSO|nr:hypothetical protein FisN_30Hh039 [Fistulifera solaris]|eukprot:GAX21839.1 hypothetical protein FisN_30Hh039 [Fistulifera solaris]